MERYKEGNLVTEQYSFIPTCFDELINEDNPVRMIEAFADSLDVEELGFKYAIPNNTGRKPYNPKTMLKIYLYGFKFFTSQKSSIFLPHSFSSFLDERIPLK